MKEIEKMTQTEYVRLELLLARALGTVRRLVRIDKAEYLESGNAVIRVLYRRQFPYLMETDGKSVFSVSRELRKV